MRPLTDLRRTLADQIEAVGGRHDEPELYGGPAGDPGLGGGPGSISWEINGDLASLVIAGPGAILMEVLHPSVMDGVFTQSSYRTDPLRRAQNTLGYVLRTTFASEPAARKVIDRVKRMHARVGGTRGDGVAYQALDPELIAWVHTCIPWAVMEAYHRYRRPLTDDERDRYLAEQAVIGRLGGADWVPTSTRELDEFVERMRPKLAVTEQTRSFIDFLGGRGVDGVSWREQRDLRTSLEGSMLLMPRWARELTATATSALHDRVVLDPLNHLKARVVRWAYPELPCARMAAERCASVVSVASGAPARVA